MSPLVSYDIIHIKRDGTEELIKNVKSAAEIPLITETPKYLGTWIKDDRKILRWSMGEIRVREIRLEMDVSSCSTFYLGKVPIYELKLRYSEGLKTICLNEHTIVGYDSSKTALWQTNSFTKLADLVGKNVAYKVQQYYEQYLQEFKVEGAI